MNTKQKTLALLVAGLTDRAVATRLGVSERTVQRYVRALMDSTQCRNRMQLGRYAALTGLTGLAALPGLPGFTPAPVPKPEGEAPDREGRQVLKALLDDACEDALRSLHMSRRSLERRIRELMTMAGAHSRVELGWRATLWGWV